MKRRNGFAVIVALAVIFCFAISAYADQGPKPPSEVIVINTPLDVNAAQSGTWDVNVANTDLEPVPVAMIPQKTPWQHSKTLLFVGGHISDTITAPPEPLTITYINTRCIFLPGPAIYTAGLNVIYDGLGSQFIIPISFQATGRQFGTDYDYWNSAQQSLIYVDAGSQITVFYSLNSSSQQGDACVLTMSGYTESAP